MKPFQRRCLAACIFALAFILFYEARGQRLVGFSSEPPGAALQGFWEQIGLGSFVVVIGAILIFKLRPSTQVVSIPGAELAVYALGLGLLIGTALVSWTHVLKKFPEHSSDLLSHRRGAVCFQHGGVGRGP